MLLFRYLLSFRYFSVLLLLLFHAAVAIGQNLVPNPGFEEYLENPNYDATGINESVDWLKLGSTTDFYHRMYSGSNGVPENFRGYQEPATGDGYAGIFNWGAPVEMLYAKLNQPLEAGVIYEVGFKVNLSPNYRYTTDDIGLSFFWEEPTIELFEEAIYHLKNPEGQLITDTIGWTDIEGYYLAKGGETYVMIGDYYPEWITTLETINPDAFAANYLYIDDVYVQRCTIDPFGPQFPSDTTICEGTSVVLSGLDGAESYFWEGIGATRHIEVTQAGTYVVQNFAICTTAQKIYTVEATVCDCSLEVPSVQYVGNQLRITTSLNVQDYEIQFYDASGKYVLSTSANTINDIQIPDLLASGMYFWRASLSCADVNDRFFDRILTGSVVIIYD